MNNPGSGAARIACPRCRANNFAGKTHCWQCSAPLPPPEALGAASQAAAPAGHGATGWPSAQTGGASRSGAQPGPPGHGSAQHTYSGANGDEFVRKWGMSRGIAVLLAVVAVGMFLAVWAIAGRMRGGSEPIRATPATAPIFAPPSQEIPVTRSAADEPDPIVAESKRFIERESRHAGLPEPPADSDGRVHLRGGGSISTEQYRDAQRHVQESPVLHTPIPAPPMP